MAEKPLIVYFTDGCHLCDDAISLLQQTNTPYLKVDIIHDQKLVDLYGHSIPVVQNDAGNILKWPFNLELLNDFIHQYR